MTRKRVKKTGKERTKGKKNEEKQERRGLMLAMMTKNMRTKKKKRMKKKERFGWKKKKKKKRKKKRQMPVRRKTGRGRKNELDEQRESDCREECIREPTIEHKDSRILLLLLLFLLLLLLLLIIIIIIIVHTFASLSVASVTSFSAIFIFLLWNAAAFSSFASLVFSAVRR